MNSAEAWEKLGAVTNKPMNRWTESRPGRVKFWIERADKNGEEAYQVKTETDREPRWFNRAIFDAYWNLWSQGSRNPNDYRDAGPTNGMFKLAYYMLPIAAALESVGSPATNPPLGDFKYEKPQTWQMAAEVVRELGGTATIEQVQSHIQLQNPLFRAANVRPDLDMVSVNAFARSNFSQNQKPRIVDGSSPFDLLFVDDHGERTYTLYDPEIHGLWELTAAAGDTKLRPRRLDIEATESELDALRDELKSDDEFDPHDLTDARTKTLRSIAQRQGQDGFRKTLLAAYEGRCAMTGCDVPQALEAAHIRPYLGERTNVVSNGLLLRSDIHTLFDLRLLRIHPTTLKIEVSAKVRGTHYEALQVTTLRPTKDESSKASTTALKWHWDACALNFEADQFDDATT